MGDDSIRDTLSHREPFMTFLGCWSERDTWREQSSGGIQFDSEAEAAAYLRDNRPRMEATRQD